VLGRNGVGKSSLLRAIVGHQPVSAGKVVFDGQDITRTNAYERARRGIAYVPQGREIFPLLRSTRIGTSLVVSEGCDEPKTANRPFADREASEMASPGKAISCQSPNG
jgi:ABC-type branched-subunit amino acid transport system ATPase component